jgi:hypothetical protein
VGEFGTFESRLEQMKAVNKLRACWPVLDEFVPHPMSGVTEPLYTVLLRLHDDEMWTKQYIADWVEECIEESIAI